MASLRDEQDPPPAYTQEPVTGTAYSFNEHTLLEMAVQAAVTKHFGHEAFTNTRDLADWSKAWTAERPGYVEITLPRSSGQAVTLWRFLCHVICCDYRVYGDEETMRLRSTARIDETIRNSFYRLAFDLRELAGLYICASNERRRCELQRAIHQMIEEPSAEICVPLCTVLDMILRYAMFINRQGFYPPGGALQGVADVFSYEDLVYKIRLDNDIIIDALLKWPANASINRALHQQAKRALECYREWYLGGEAKVEIRRFEKAQRDAQPTALTDHFRGLWTKLSPFTHAVQYLLLKSASDDADVAEAAE